MTVVARGGGIYLLAGGDYGDIPWTSGWAFGNGVMTFFSAYPGVAAWSITASGTSNISSDARMKEDVRPVANALSRLLQVRGVEFTWKKGSPDEGKRSLGVIAQEVEKVFPELVSEGKERETVAYTPLIAPLIESIRVLADQVKELSKQVAELNEQNLFLQKKFKEIAK